MRRAVRWLFSLVGVAGLAASGCGAHPRTPAAQPAFDRVTLYRDRALVTQRVDIVVTDGAPTGTTATTRVKLAAGVGPDDVVVLDRGGLTVSALRVAGASAAPTEVELATSAPRAGRYTVSLGYATDRLAWDVAYTMTTSPARDRATVRGALVIRNTSGVTLRDHAYIADAVLGAPRDLGVEQLRRAFADTAPRTPAVARCDLGIVSLGPGETRVDLLAGSTPRKLRSVLIYDPIGTALDHLGAAPLADPGLGVTAAAPTRVTESFEFDRAELGAAGLPAGPLRVLERRGWAKDDDQQRFSEELLITIDNARPLPVDIVIREHLYRGQNWTLAYQSAPAIKEGPQQISLRTTVPANGQSKVLYVVVYTW